MRLVAVVAASRPHWVIGQDGRLPWRLREDLRRFRELTTGHPVIMGRKTFESIGRPLPDRRNIVLSREGCGLGDVTVRSLDQALKTARAWGTDRAFVVGGGEIYQQAVPLCDEVLMTLVDAPEITHGTRLQVDFAGLYLHSCEWLWSRLSGETHDIRFERWVRR